MSRIIKHKRIYMCMASVMCMLLLLIPLPVSANDQGSILLKATVEDETTVYKLSNIEFTMYQVGTYKNNSWALVSEFAKLLRITTEICRIWSSLSRTRSSSWLRSSAVPAAARSSAFSRSSPRPLS